MIWNLSVWIKVAKESINNTVATIKTEFQKLWWDLEKITWSNVFSGLKKSSSETINTIWGLNQKLDELKNKLNLTEIWTEKFRQLQKEIKNTENALDKATNKTWGFINTLKTLWPAITAAFVFTKVWEFWKSIFDLTAKTEQLEKSFKTLTWSEEKAKAVLEQIDWLAEQSPFEKFKLAEHTQKLIWFWIEADKAVNIMQVLWNTVSAVGGNEDTLWGLVLALWQIQAKWKLSQEELNQFAERWVPAMEILREKLHLTQEDLWNIWAKWIEASEAIPALLEWLQERYLWALAEQSQTLTGQLANLQDEVSSQMAKTWKDMQWNFKEIVGWISNIVKTNLPFILSIFKNSFNSILTIWKTIFWALWNIFNTFTWTVKSWSWQQVSFLNKVLFWVQLLWNWIWFLADIFAWVVKVWLTAFGDLWENIKIFWGNTVKLFGNLWYNMWVWLSNIWPSMRNWLKSAAKTLQDWVNGAIDLLNTIPFFNIWKATFADNLSFEKTESLKSLTDWMEAFKWFWNTMKAVQEATYSTLDNNTKRFQELYNNMNDIWKEHEKKFDLNKMDDLWRAINDKKEKLKWLQKWTEEYIKTESELLEMEGKLKDMLYTQWKWQKEAEKWKKWAWKASKKLKKDEKELKEETKKLEDEVNNLKEAYSDLEKWLEKIEKTKEDFKKDSLKLEEEIRSGIDKTNTKLREQQAEYQKNIDLIKAQREEKLKNNDEKFEENVWKRSAELDKEVKKIEKQLKDLEAKNRNNTISNASWVSREFFQSIWKNSIFWTTWDDLIKVQELAESLKKIKEEQKEISDLMNREWINTSNINSAKSIAEKSKTYQLVTEWEKNTEKINSDFNKKEKEKLDKLNEETEKAEKLVNLYKILWETQKISAEEYKNLIWSEKFKNLSQDEQDIITKIWEEKVKLTEQQNFILSLEQEISNKKVELSQKTTELLEKNLTKLWHNYKRIISDIEKAISKQRELNSLTGKSSWLWFADWWYTGDGGKYEVAGRVHRWEYVIPQEMLRAMPTLMPSLEAIRTGNTTNNNYNTNKSIDVWGITVNSEVDLELFFEKQKWRL